jgi:diadenosine tetraphosphate (Ap4A) HIT family hydrolase
MDCELCVSDGGRLLWRDNFCRIVRVPSDDYPGYCRVVLNRHASEMTDLDAGERERLMRAVFACETAVRELFDPEKINLASLGNQVPHLHWHVIARHVDDRHFPDPIWAAARRNGRTDEAGQRAAVTDARLADALGALLARPRS